MMGLIIGGFVIIVLTLVVVLFFFIHDNNVRLATVNDAIETEIRNFLIIKKDIDYMFKDENIEQQMKNEIKIVILDLQHNKYTLNKAYINKSENKIEQISHIINKYYQLDKKTNIKIDNEEVENN